jgi:hypothetical protein
MSDTINRRHIVLGVGLGAADGIDDALGLRGEQTPSTQRMFAGIGGREEPKRHQAPSWSKSTSR